MSNKQSFAEENFKCNALDRDLYTSSQIRERALNAAIVGADVEQGYESVWRSSTPSMATRLK
jgi:hypothetical protein